MKTFYLFFLFLPVVALSQKTFTDVTKEAGIDNIYDVYQGLFGGGAVAFDYNNDGYEDLFITGGLSQDILYKNNGDGSFSDVTIEAGISIEGFGLGVAISDVNYDGWPDIFIGNDYITNDLLYINNQDGTFSNKIRDFMTKFSYH